MNTPILRMSRLVGALFALLLISATIIQFVQAPSLRARSDNHRTMLDNFSRDRGSILVGETAIAVSKPSEGELAFLRSAARSDRNRDVRARADALARAMTPKKKK